MSHVMACWRREWQAHRAVLLTLLVLLTVLAPLVYFATPRPHLAYGGFEIRLVAVYLGVLLVTVAAELMVQRPANELARRLPRTLAAPLVARLAFFFTLTGGAVGFGIVCSWILVSLFPERMPTVPATHLGWYLGATWIIGVAVGLWLMLVSCWLRLPLLSIPGATVLRSNGCGSAPTEESSSFRSAIDRGLAADLHISSMRSNVLPDPATRIVRF